jgi:hypothetical protein
MKEYLFLFFIFILSISCKQRSSELAPHDKMPTPIEAKINDSISGVIDPNLSSFGFKFIVDTAENQLAQIKIYREEKLVQTINTNKICENYEYSLHDWNIDGFKDISVLYERSVTGNESYWIWSYSPKQRKFVFNMDLSERGLLVDSTSKYIIFHERMGIESEFWDSCQFINNELRTIRYFEKQHWNDQYGKSWVKYIRKKRMNGILIETVDSCLLERK